MGALLRSLVAGLALWPLAAMADAPAVLLVGDSTMAPQTGYGDALCARLEPATACLNLARGGRSTLSYRAEGLWDRVIARLKAGEPGVPRHVLIQFGHNDQPGKPGRSTDLATEYPVNLARYVAEVRAAGGQPVLVTPLTRRSFKDGQLVDDLAPWAEAMRGVARQEQVPLLDLHARSAALVRQLGSEQADLLAQGPPGHASFDRTHLGPRGACVFADLVAQGLAELVPRIRPLPLATPCLQIAPPSVPPPRVALDRATFDEPGWAITTLGGRGGRVVAVTNLKAEGPGSLRAALEARGPRLIVFEVGGVIDLAGARLRIREPFVTIAGQTAPRPGITLIRGELNIATHDVIVQHLMLRPGAWGRAARSGGDQDGISTRGAAHHVVVDHCSISWATDENLSVSGPRFDGADVQAWRRNTSHDITYSHNLLYEGLGHSVHEKGEHSKGSLIHDNATGVLLFGNLYASNRERNALFKGGAHAAMVNNFIFNPGRRAVHYNLHANEWAGHEPVNGRVALVGNVLRHGPDTAPGTPLFGLGGQGDVELHLDDNRAADAQGQPVPLTGRYTSSAARTLPLEPAVGLPPRLRALPAEQLEAQVLQAAGARPWDRDPIDARILAEVSEGLGRIPDREEEAGGYPAGPRYQPGSARFDATQWNLSDMSPRAGWASLFARMAK